MYWHEDLNNLGNAHLFKKGVVFGQNSTLDRTGKSVCCETLDDFGKGIISLESIL